MTQLKILFDYATLDTETRITIQQRTGEIRERMRRATQDIAEIGERLIEVKKALGHGNFGGWVKAEFDWDLRMAQRFMAVAEKFGKSDNLSLFAPSALFMLAAPSTPEEARAEALERANAGIPVRHSDAKELVSRSRNYKEEVQTFLARAQKTDDNRQKHRLVQLAYAAANNASAEERDELLKLCGSAVSQPEQAQQAPQQRDYEGEVRAILARAKTAMDRYAVIQEAYAVARGSGASRNNLMQMVDDAVDGVWPSPQPAPSQAQQAQPAPSQAQQAQPAPSQEPDLLDESVITRAMKVGLIIFHRQYDREWLYGVQLESFDIANGNRKFTCWVNYQKLLALVEEKEEAVASQPQPAPQPQPAQPLSQATGQPFETPILGKKGALTLHATHPDRDTTVYGAYTLTYHESGKSVAGAEDYDKGLEVLNRLGKMTCWAWMSGQTEVLPSQRGYAEQSLCDAQKAGLLVWHCAQSTVAPSQPLSEQTLDQIEALQIEVWDSVRLGDAEAGAEAAFHLMLLLSPKLKHEIRRLAMYRHDSLPEFGSMAEKFITESKQA